MFTFINIIPVMLPDCSEIDRLEEKSKQISRKTAQVMKDVPHELWDTILKNIVVSLLSSSSINSKQCDGMSSVLLRKCVKLFFKCLCVCVCV